jgi:hypothetical protein
MRDSNRDRTDLVPEADALEQATSVDDDADEERELPHGMPDDAAEGDALEQATTVPGSDDDTPR